MYALAVLTLLQVPRVNPDGGYREHPVRALAAGMRYTAQDAVLAGMIIVAMARFLFSGGYSTYMPKFAEEVLHFDAAGLGKLQAAPGLGALLASLGMASLRDYKHKGRLLLGTGIGMGAVLILYGMTRNVPLVFAMLVVLGACGNILRVANQTILQTGCDALPRSGSEPVWHGHGRRAAPQRADGRPRGYLRRAGGGDAAGGTPGGGVRRPRVVPP